MLPLKFKSIICCIFILIALHFWSRFDFALQNNNHFHRNSIDFQSKEGLHYNNIREPLVIEKRQIKNKSESNSLKYILIWTSPLHYEPTNSYGIGQKSFIESKCIFTNCYVTDNRTYLGGDITKFDVIAFNGRLMGDMRKNQLPKIRSPHQKYLFANSESSANYPLKKPFFDDFFNWTLTYKLNSDFIFPYFTIKNKKGDIVGPKNNMTWDELKNELPFSFFFNFPYLFSPKISVHVDIKSKKKAAAWFVSRCYSLSGREIYVRKLNSALRKHNLKVDIYGSCGVLHCPRKEYQRCYDILKRDYFFYLSFENSFSEDYVTEKVVTAMINDVIPIVWGGANYSKFLPPNSYIDARKMEPADLAKLMNQLVNNKLLYLSYFTWKKYYTYKYVTYNVCGLCEAINDESRIKAYSSYKQFRKWWN